MKAVSNNGLVGLKCSKISKTFRTDLSFFQYKSFRAIQIVKPYFKARI